MAGLNTRKFKELVLYIAHRCKDDDTFGAVKLNKILYYSDFEAYRRLGNSITWAIYQHLDEGPAPIEFLGIKDALIEEEAIVYEYIQYHNYQQHRIITKRQPRTDLFTKDELEIVDCVIDRLWHLNASQVSALSHQEIGWMATSTGEEIPYTYSWIAAAPPTDRQIAKARELEKLDQGRD